MSYDQFLYKASKDTPPMNEWVKDLSLPFGSHDEIKKRFEAILGPLKWHNSPNGGCWSEGCFTDHGFEISLYSDNNLIRLIGCSQIQAIEMAKKLELYACDPQSGEKLNVS